jgi:hypothetical protein
MDFEAADGGVVNGEFSIEPYSAGGRDEPPSGGYALLEGVKVAGFPVPSAEWGKLGLDAERIEELEERAYRDWREECTARYEAAVDARIDERRERGA